MNAGASRRFWKVEAHVSVAFLLCFKGVGVSCFGIFQFSSHAFQPFLDRIFTPLYAFPCAMEYDKIIGVPDACRSLVDLFSVETGEFWSTCPTCHFFHPMKGYVR